MRTDLAGDETDDHLTRAAAALEKEGIFLSGPAKFFEVAGRKTLMTLLAEGLTPQARTLDVGCGCLRCGYWLIHFLDPERYFGTEPNRESLSAGLRLVLEPGLAELKRPRFDYNADFDFGAFGERFDFVIARSVWTHASKPQIEHMLDEFVAHSSKNAVFLTSYHRPSIFRRDYRGTGWVGKSHESTDSGVVAHSLRWIRARCAERGLTVEEVADPTLDFSHQRWLRIRHRD